LPPRVNGFDQLRLRALLEVSRFRGSRSARACPDGPRERSGVEANRL